MNPFEKACREWMRGCSCAAPQQPWECDECSKAFHDQLQRLVAEQDPMRQVIESDGMDVFVLTDPDLIAAIQGRSVRAPERDVGNVTCWREAGAEHYFIEGHYWRSLPFIPVG